MSLRAFGIDPNSWEMDAQNRSAWRSSLYKGSERYEDDRTAAAVRRRQERKARALAPRTSQDINIPCPHCNRTFRAQIGLISHLRNKH